MFRSLFAKKMFRGKNYHWWCIQKVDFGFKSLVIQTKIPSHFIERILDSLKDF